MATNIPRFSEKQKLENKYRRKCFIAALNVIRNNCDDFMPPEKTYLKDNSDDRAYNVTSAEFGFKHGETRLCYEVVKSMLNALLNVRMERSPDDKKQVFIALGFFLQDNNEYLDALGLDNAWVKSQINKLLNAIGLPKLKLLLKEYKQCEIKI